MQGYSLFLGIFLSTITTAVYGQDILERYREAQTLFIQGKYTEALPKLERVAKSARLKPQQVALTSCRIGIIHSLKTRFSQAKSYLVRSLKDNSLPSKDKTLCQFALLQILVLNEENSSALSLLKSMGDIRFSPKYRARVYALGAVTSKRLRRDGEEKRYLSLLAGVMQKFSIEKVPLKILGNFYFTLKQVKARQRKLLETQADPSEGLAQENLEPIGKGQERAGEEILGYSLSPENIWQSELGDVANRFQASIRPGQILKIGHTILPSEKMIARVKKLQDDEVRFMRVGVILPKVTEMTAFSHEIIRGITAFLESNAAKGVNYSFHFKPAKIDLESARKAASDLIFDKKVHVILGPIASTAQALGVVDIANSTGVPVFTLGPLGWSQELESKGLVRMGVLAKSQASLLLETMKGRGVKKAAVFAPNDLYGIEMAQTFRKLTKSYGIKVVRAIFYKSGTRVFQEEVDALLGDQSLARRIRAFPKIVREAKREARANNRKFDPSTLNLPAVVDFDALFVPETLESSKIIAATLAYMEADKIPLYVDKQWLESKPKRDIGEPLVQGTIVPAPVTGRFTQSYLKITDSKREFPFFKLAEQSFDALILIRQTQYLSRSNWGPSMMRSLKGREFKVDGIARYEGPVNPRGEPSALFTPVVYKKQSFDLP